MSILLCQFLMHNSIIRLKTLALCFIISWPILWGNNFFCAKVRGYAVSVLERADDEELQCYLLQLVQALRFERSDKSRLALFLVNRGMFKCLRKYLIAYPSTTLGPWNWWSNIILLFYQKEKKWHFVHVHICWLDYHGCTLN